MKVKKWQGNVLDEAFGIARRSVPEDVNGGGMTERKTWLALLSCVYPGCLELEGFVLLAVFRYLFL
jgi:hypothetical protein